MFAYIPARSGSKRILNKNIKKIGSKPIISYVIDNLKKLHFLKGIIVSTDSNKIKNICEKEGALCYDLRKKDLSNDSANFIDLIKNDIPRYQEKFENDNNLLFVLATAALVDKKTFEKAYKIYLKKKPEVLIPCKKYSVNPYMSMFLNKKKYLQSLFPKKILLNSQNLNDLYYDAGLFYFMDISKIRKLNSIKNSKKILPFVVTDQDGIDIDTMDDWNKFKDIFNKGTNN